MSNKFSDLTRRSGTATLFALVMIAGIFIGPETLILLLGLILFLGLREIMPLILIEEDTSLAWYKTWGTLVAMVPYIWTATSKWLGGPPNSDAFLGELVFVLPFSIALMVELLKPRRQLFKRIGAIAIGLLYLVVPMCLLLDLAITPNDFRPEIVMGILLLNWINDSGAYFVGSWLGKRKLFYQISPGKTWEGSIGGLILVVAIGSFFPLWFGVFNRWDWMALALIVAIFGTIGDLVESMLKRNTGIKDSGKLMPGHGGILDRFDAFFFLIPFAYLYIRLFANQN